MRLVLSQHQKDTFMSTLTKPHSSHSRASSGPRGLGAILAPYSGQAYAILRIVGGLALAFHGMMKVFGMYMPAEYIPKAFSQGWFGGYIELITGILVALGAFTPYAAFLASGTMAVAYIQFHWKLAFNSNFFPATSLIAKCANSISLVAKGESGTGSVLRITPCRKKVS